DLHAGARSRVARQVQLLRLDRNRDECGPGRRCLDCGGFAGAEDLKLRTAIFSKRPCGAPCGYCNAPVVFMFLFCSMQELSSPLVGSGGAKPERGDTPPPGFLKNNLSG